MEEMLNAECAVVTELTRVYCLYAVWKSCAGTFAGISVVCWNVGIGLDTGWVG
jgi:hypothetical protein